MIRDVVTVADVIIYELAVESYRRAIRSNVRALWKSFWTVSEFNNAMQSTILRGLEQAWDEGARECGIGPGERSQEEQAELIGFVNSALTFVEQFGGSVEAGSQAAGEKLAPHMQRAEIWVNRYNEVRAQAKVTSCADRKFTWKLGRTEEHCVDCLNLDGRTHRGSIWSKHRIRPQSRRLSCGGWRCDCTLNQTDAKANPGRPPNLVGP